MHRTSHMTSDLHTAVLESEVGLNESIHVRRESFPGNPAVWLLDLCPVSENKTLPLPAWPSPFIQKV